MKKIVVTLLSVCLMVGTCFVFTGCTPREETLRIYNWGDYMSKDTYKGFKDWFKDKTGKNVKVVYKKFDTNETMYTQIAKKEADYDLVCPSDYMVERMIREQLLLPLDDETRDIVTAAVNPGLKELMVFDSDLTYTMPYLWGTMGIMYNAKAAGQTQEKMSSWDVLFSTEFGTNKVWMKDSVKDSFMAAILAHNKDTLLTLSANGTDYTGAAYRDKLVSLFSIAPDTAANIATAEEKLKAQKKNVKGYEVDNAKTTMLRDVEGTKGEYGMFWSCDAGYIMSGDRKGLNQNLRYVVPTEGSNVWVDSFVIPKFAKNVEAANWFIRYLCEEGIGYDCMDFAGCTSAVLSEAQAYEEDLIADEDGFFRDAPQGFKEMYMEMMFPSDEVLSRCAIMRDLKDETNDYNRELDKMWERVKTHRG